MNSMLYDRILIKDVFPSISTHNKFDYFIYSYIDFSINELSTENRLRSQRTAKPYKIKVNNCKLLDFFIRI